jgi:Ca2+-binding EF-hand superfamily protein
VTGTATLPDAQGNTTTVISHLPVPPARDYRAMFDAMDVDHDGVISRREASDDKYLLRAYAALDSDGNHMLDYQEMLRWLDD